MTVTLNQVAADMLLDELAARGITVKVHAGNLALWPRDRLTSGLRGRLREHKPELLRALRLAALDEDQRDAWEERVAICVIDGGLSETEAEAVAWREIEAAQDAHVGAGAATGAASVGSANRRQEDATRANVGRVGAFPCGI